MFLLAEDMATAMAKLIDTWLGNPALRKAIALTTKDCKKCGKRIDLALREYTGEKIDLCIKCRAASFTIKKVLDTFISKGKMDKQIIIDYLKQPMWRKGLAAVLEGIAEFGPKKPFIAASPFLMVWNITKLCNLKCIHCYENAKVRAPDEMTTEEAISAVDKMADAGVAYIAISGGEPLMHPDFFKIAKRIQEREMAFSIATNATLLTKENAKKLREFGCIYAQVSVDGANAETHNKFRGVNSFERTMEGIKNLVNEKITVGISSTITKHNLKEVPELIDLSEKLGVQIFMAYNFIPTGRGKEIVDMDISPREREELLEYLVREQKKRKLNILSTAPQYSRVCQKSGLLSMTHFDVFGNTKEMVDNVKFLAEFVGGCGAGRLYATLEPNGDIKPCVFIPIVNGNIKKDDFKKVWLTDKTLNKLRHREEFFGHCRKCESRNICGGCRARAYSYFGDVQGPDPGCILNENQWEQLKEQVQVRTKK